MDSIPNTTPAPRIPLQLFVEYRRSYARRVEKGRIKNISISGAFLEFEEQVDLLPNDKVTLTLNVSGRKRTITAHVIWNTQSGCGVKFQPTNNRDVQIVDDLMYFAENSRSSQREVLDSIFKKVA